MVRVEVEWLAPQAALVVVRVTTLPVLVQVLSGKVMTAEMLVLQVVVAAVVQPLQARMV
jgi:hypothetical protein